MKSFSLRNGYTSPHPVLQYESMDSRLRGDLYNILFEYLMERFDGDTRNRLRKDVWAKVWHLPLDQIVYEPALIKGELSSRVSNRPWYEVFDLIERVASDLSEIKIPLRPWRDECDAGDETEYDGFADEVNEILEDNDSAYRLVDGFVVAITDDSEIESIKECLEAPDRFSGARLHMSKALKLYSDRPVPDYANSVKESISAVESAAKTVLGNENADLNGAVNELRKKRGLHPALAEGWKKLYAFTCDEGGVRHAAGSEELRVDSATAKYMLVSCSAFVNYLVQTFGQEGV